VVALEALDAGAVVAADEALLLGAADVALEDPASSGACDELPLFDDSVDAGASVAADEASLLFADDPSLLGATDVAELFAALDELSLLEPSPLEEAVVDELSLLEPSPLDDAVDAGALVAADEALLLFADDPSLSGAADVALLLGATKVPLPLAEPSSSSVLLFCPLSSTVSSLEIRNRDLLT
jgi:hypothetical protein